ncbi:MAG: BadF/BadG/BcrA/BcrD ATPase family protein [Fidelibacterota bacterium]
MKVYLGIDLGSTTSKAVITNRQGKIIGRGITNTRSNYEVAADIARIEAEFNARFSLLYNKLKEDAANGVNWDEIFPHLENRFHFLEFQQRFHKLMATMAANSQSIPDIALREKIGPIVTSLTATILDKIRDRFFNSEVSTSSEFFRELFSSVYMHQIQEQDITLYEHLIALYDRSITPVENEALHPDFGPLVKEAITLLPEEMSEQCKVLEEPLNQVSELSLEPADYVGTGYGRQLLPFEEQHIKSEILCHALGAHACFPLTRTVLDIGGQDTKAIQVDKHGLVTSFQMNDRCAAGCGRYLGYIADEMNISVGELGPIAMEADYEANICSTCTVFAGAELREYLNLGEKKENVLAGLHKAIVLRAFALLARSGGVRNEFTFTGGVARNTAVVKYVKQMVHENYGTLKINNHPDSIFMGALGAALFSARRKNS